MLPPKHFMISDFVDKEYTFLVCLDLKKKKKKVITTCVQNV